MPGRKFSSTTQYRYGFNGKENDNEVKGEGNEQDYGMRIYDPRLGRFLSVDPLTKEYPWYSPYSFAGNKPIWCIDIDGGEERIVTIYKGADGKTHQQVYRASDHFHTEWSAIQKSFAGGFAKQKTSGYEWTGGFLTYNLLSHGSDKNNIEWSGPPRGTLTINATGNVITVNYDDAKVKGSTGVKTATFAQSVKMGAKGFKDFFITPNKLVEGSEASVNSVNAYLAGFSVAFGAPEAVSGKVIPILSSISGFDDIGGGEKGAFSSQKLKDNHQGWLAMINIAKFGIGLVSRTTDVISLAKDMEDGYRLIKNSTIVLKDTYDSIKSGKETGQSVKEALDVTK